MSLTSWILDRLTNLRAKAAGARRTDEVMLYLRRLEDRRVLSLTAVPDAYFVQDAGISFSASAQLGVLSNDSDANRAPVTALGGDFTTDQGGSGTLDPNGAFSYIPPANIGSIFVDHFIYTATNGNELVPADVTLFVGEVPVPFDQPVLLPLFGVETLSPGDMVNVNLYSSQGASLMILNPEFLIVTSGNNGGSDLSFTGTAADVNRALDSLEYSADFSGPDDLYFDYFVNPPEPPQFALTQPATATVSPGSSQVVPIFVVPPEGPSSVVAVDDAYFIDSPMSSTFFPRQAGVLSNDFSTSGQPLFAFSDSMTTDLGGTVDLFSDGAFVYTPPTDPNLGPKFIDSFTYFASDEGSVSPGFVTLYVGEVPIFEDEPVLLPLFTVESETQSDFVTVQITSLQGSSLIILDPSGIFFNPGQENGGSTIAFSGLAKEINFALDTLVYIPPMNYSGDDFIFFEYNVFGEPISEFVPIDVLPIADRPGLFISPAVVDYLPLFPAPVDIHVVLTDVDGSEIPGLVILQNVPMGVFPSVGQQSPVDPGTFFVLPSDLENLSFVVDFAAPEFFTIDVIATVIETTDEPGAFGGPGGPLLPDSPFELRFAFTVGFVSFSRMPMPDEPPPPPPKPPAQAVFLLGPFSPPPPPKLINGPENTAAPDAPNVVASVIESHESTDGQDGSNSPVAAAENEVSAHNSASTEEQQNEESRRSSDTSGIYVQKLGSEEPGRFAKLPPELSEDYPRFMAFLKTLPNGDYVVYFKQGGQSHEQAVLRQVVVRVRVVNHRLNPDSGEFKPAGEVAEPPQDANSPTLPAATKAPGSEERAELPASANEWINGEETAEPPAFLDEWTPITAGIGIAALAGWRFHSQQNVPPGHVDRLMECFSRKPFQRFQPKRKAGNRNN